MNQNRFLVVALVSLATMVAGIAWWLLSDDGRQEVADTVVPTAEGPGAPTEADTQRVPTKVESQPYTEPLQEGGEATRPTLRDLGSLSITLIRAQDRVPIQGATLVVSLLSSNSRWPRTLRAQTDVHGTAMFEGLQPGDVRIETPGLTRRRPKIEAGRLTRLTLLSTLELKLRGRVSTQEGAAIEGAKVYLGTNGPSQALLRVATSVANGTFEVLYSGGQWPLMIGARSESFGPSSLVQIRKASELSDEIPLILGKPSGTLEGSVVSESGAPIEGARIFCGRTQSQRALTFDHFNRFYPKAQVITSDSQGAFVLKGVEPGKHPLSVVAAGWTAIHSEIDIRSREKNYFQYRMLRTGVVEVQLRGGDHRVLPGALVSLRIGPKDAMPTRSTDGQGRCRFSDVPSGTVIVSARTKSGGSAVQEIVVQPGKLSKVELLALRSPRPRGLLVDDLGSPQANWVISVSSLDPHRPHQESQRTDDAGNFEFKGKSSARLSVRASSPVAEGSESYWSVRRTFDLGILEAKDAPWRLTVPRQIEPRAFLIGVLSAPGGKVLPAPLCRVRSELGAALRQFTVDAQSGAFRLGPLLPGAYSLEFFSGGRKVATHSIKQLRKNQTLDLGTIQAQAP